jgi:hypothetical protein
MSGFLNCVCKPDIQRSEEDCKVQDVCLRKNASYKCKDTELKIEEITKPAASWLNRQIEGDYK